MLVNIYWAITSDMPIGYLVIAGICLVAIIVIAVLRVMTDWLELILFITAILIAAAKFIHI